MSTPEAIYSSFGADPELADLVRWFVEKLSPRMLDMAGAYGRGDFNELGRLAHQMKGAAGSYGFPQITDAAAELESAVRVIGSPAAMARSLERLTALCRQARAGLPPEFAPPYAGLRLAQTLPAAAPVLVPPLP